MVRGVMGARRRARLCGVLAPLCVAALVGLGAEAATAQPVFNVDSTADEPDAAADGRCVSSPSGRCTLRAAIMEIENLSSGEVILPAGVYRLDRPELALGGRPTADGDLDIDKDPTIQGAGPSRTIIDGMGSHRILDIHANGEVTVSGVHLRNGLATFSFPTHHRHGGAIHNHGSLVLENSAITDSQANEFGQFGRGGGGLTNAGSGRAHLRNVTIARNSTLFFGGGIENGGVLELFNVTITENTAPFGWGAGIASGVGLMTGGNVRVHNSIVANNQPQNTNNCADKPTAQRTIHTQGHNLDNWFYCRFDQLTDRQAANPALVPLPDNAGNVFLYGLQAGSQAIDAGGGPNNAPPGALGCPPTDQQGGSRPQDGDGDGAASCDIGAFELGRTLRLATPPTRGDEVRWVELRLNFHGAGPLTVDGDYGPATAAAVRRFQAQRGLPVTGEVGPDTYHALAALPRTLRLTTPHMRGDDVRWVELRLNVHGAGPLTVDGDYGPATEAAVRRYQAQRGLAVTGEVGPEVYEALAAGM
jgi:CSLREA domain-containing protein